MKLQSLAIIFIIIVFPMILILSYYISLQIDTVTLYNKYNNELIDATNDAMSALELNTANEELSNVSDSLRSIIDASTNTFINTLSTSLGLSNVNKHDIQPYIPSILYTMYDGYYIYAPTQTPVILEKTRTDAVTGLITSEGAATVGEKAIDGSNSYYNESGTLVGTVPHTDAFGSLLYKQRGSNTYSPNIDGNTEFKTDYVLKSYMPYSATYIDRHGTDRATINYTLDNFMSISAQIGDVYYTKSGYYINQDIVSSCNIANWDTMGQDQLLEECKNGQNVEIILNDTNNTTIGYTAIPNPSDPTKILSIEEVEKQLQIYYDEYQILIHAMPRNDTEIINKLNEIRPLETALANIKAITYYLTNSAFSNWVNSNLDFVIGDNLETVVEFDHLEDIGYSLENMNAMFHDFDDDLTQVFSAGNDPENEDSAFNNHKYNIIKNSIQYNLNLAISSYSEMFNGVSFEMPQLLETEWEEITKKISMVTYLQGLDCGLKQFNGYSIVSSTNNEMTVIPEEIYYVKEDEFNSGVLGDYYYHRIDCETIRRETGNFISFKSKEVKYDDVYKGEELVDGEGYSYDHNNLACYDCVIQNNYLNFDSDSDGIDDKKIKLRAFLNFEEDDNEGVPWKNDFVNTNLQKAYLIAIAKERQNLYKTTAYSKNEGIETDSSNDISWDPSIAKAEITLRYEGNSAVVGNIWIGGYDTGKQIPATHDSIQVLELENTANNGDIICYIDGDTDPQTIDVLSIKYIYK